MPISPIPGTIPVPRHMPITPKERRLLSEPPGPRDSRTVAREFVGEHDVQWLLNEAQSAAFVTWYRTDLIEGGAWFSARWPMPQGLVLLERQFIGAPRWQFAGNGFWRVSARVQFRSTGVAPPPPDDTGSTPSEDYLHDLFDGDDATNLADHSPNIGGSWVHFEGLNSAFISGNRLEIDASFGVPCVFYNQTTIPSDDVAFRVDFDASLVSNGEFALHRNGESGSATADRLFELFLLSDGTANYKVRQEASVNVAVLASGNVVVVERTGGEWRLTVNDVLVDTVADGDQFTGKLGFYAQGNDDYMFLTRLSVYSI